MTSTAPELTDQVAVADVAPTPADLLARVREQRRTADQAEAAVLVLAVEWAHAHPALPGDESWKVTAAQAVNHLEEVEDRTLEDYEDYGIPAVHWAAPAAFAAANNMSTTAGKALLRDALVLRHRLPHVWARATTGKAQVWRARRIAQAVLGAPADVVDHIDRTLAPVAHKVGPITLTRLLDEAMLRLHPEQAELEQTEAERRRHVTVDNRTTAITGLAEMIIRGDWKDIHDLDHTLTALAHALADTPEGAGHSVEVRRAIAAGILADPERALALLEGAPAPQPRKQMVLYLHLTDAALLGLDLVGRNQTTGQPVLEQQIREWCGRTDTHLTVKPVIDLAEHVAVEAYEIPDRLAERIKLTHPRCMFPWCTHPSQTSDCDHRIPYADGGPTCECNLTPLCRHHHRLKTHAGWRYTRIEPSVYLWTDPHHQQFLTDHDGTTTLTPD